MHLEATRLIASNAPVSISCSPSFQDVFQICKLVPRLISSAPVCVLAPSVSQSTGSFPCLMEARKRKRVRKMLWLAAL